MSKPLVAAVALTATMLVGAAGCASGGGAPGAGAGATPAPSKPADPKAELAAATAALTTAAPVGYAWNLKDAGNSIETTGRADPKRQDSEQEMRLRVEGQSMTMGFRAVGADRWLRITAPGKAGASLGTYADTWMHFSAATVKAASPFSGSYGGPKDVSDALGKAAAVRSTGPNRYAGTVDIRGTAFGGKDTLEELGTRVAAVPFTAVTDGQGRLASVTFADLLEGSSKKKGDRTDLTITFSDYGAPLTVQRPTGKVVELPKALADGLLQSDS